MFALITDQHGQELARYTLADTDPLNCDTYAQRYADAIGYDLDHSDGEIPGGLGDFTVTLTEQPENTAVCWSSRSYFLSQE